MEEDNVWYTRSGLYNNLTSAQGSVHLRTSNCNSKQHITGSRRRTSTTSTLSQWTSLASRAQQNKQPDAPFSLSSGLQIWESDHWQCYWRWHFHLFCWLTMLPPPATSHFLSLSDAPTFNKGRGWGLYGLQAVEIIGKLQVSGILWFFLVITMLCNDFA